MRKWSEESESITRHAIRRMLIQDSALKLTCSVYWPFISKDSLRQDKLLFSMFVFLFWKREEIISLGG